MHSKIRYFLTICALMIFGYGVVQGAWASADVAPQNGDNHAENGLKKLPTMTYTTADNEEVTLPVVTSLANFEKDYFAFESRKFPTSKNFLMELCHTASKAYKSAEPIYVAAKLLLPELKENEKRATLVWIPGSYGMAKRQELPFAKYIVQKAGVAVAILDYNRSVSNRSAEKNQLEESIIGQVYATYMLANLLTTHPRLNGQFIAGGDSRGGLVADLLSRQDLKDYFSPQVGFIGHLVFSGIPLIQYSGKRLLNGLTGEPIFYYHGSDDDWNDVEQIRRYVQRLHGIQYPVKLVEFSGAHGFHKRLASGFQPDIVNLSEACLVVHDPLPAFMEGTPGLFANEEATKKFLDGLQGFTPLGNAPYKGDKEAVKLNWMQLSQEMSRIKKGGTLGYNEESRKLLYPQIVGDLLFLLRQDEELGF